MTYIHLKRLNIALGAIGLPWSTFTGYQLGQGHYSVALVSLALQTLYVWAQSALYWRVMEQGAGWQAGEARTRRNAQASPWFDV